MAYCSGKKPSEPGSFRSLNACAVGSAWVGAGNKPLDLATGNPTDGPKFIDAFCSPTSSTPNYLFTSGGTMLDVHTNSVVRMRDMRSPCDEGTLVSDGYMITLPSECICWIELKGWRVLASAGAINPHIAPPWKERLTVSDTAEPEPLNVTDADWPTYRRDGARSAGSTATIGNASRVLWQWKASGAAPYSSAYGFALGPKLKPDFLSTAPVAADGWVWFGSPDGMVRCVKADSGKEVWSFATHAMLFTSPTLWQGRLLIGSGDGRVYCLNARTGKCLWQLLIAPSDRRVFWFGHLINTWPVLTGVGVQDGIAYAIAGWQSENGLHSYAINPKNGEVIWANDAAGQSTSCGGGIAMAHGKVWTPNSCFDPKSGAGYTFLMQYGREVGVFDKWILNGGQRISHTEDIVFTPAGGGGLYPSLFDPKDGGTVSGTGALLADWGISLPAWDADHILMPPRAAVIAGGALNTGLTLVPAAKFSAWLSEYPAAHAAFAKAPNDAKPQLIDWPELKEWVTDKILAVSFALARDQAVVAYTDGKVHKLSGYLRADGKKAWTVELPEQPAMNRLAVDRAGRVVVSLCDGSVVCVGQ